MQPLYLYFVDTATPGRGPSSAADEVRPDHDDAPLISIQPGAFSRWKANRDRVVAENAAGYGRAVAGSAVRRLPAPETTIGPATSPSAARRLRGSSQNG